MIKQTRAEPFKKYLLCSFLVHGLVVFFIFIQNVYFPSKPTRYLPSVRVDLVALPNKVYKKVITKNLPKPKKQKSVQVKSQPKKKLPQKKKPKIKAKAKPKVKSKTIRQMQKKAIEQLKAQVALEKTKKEPPQKTNWKQEFKGNIIAAGTHLTGLAQIQHEDYQKELDFHVKQYWELPKWLDQDDLRATALVKINQQGFVVEKKILHSSGNFQYDKIVLETIDRASPFPKPAKKFFNIVRIDGIILGFPE